MISKINHFFDSSAQVSRGALLKPNMAPSPVEVAVQNVTKSYSGKAFTNAEEAYEQHKNGHVQPMSPETHAASQNADEKHIPSSAGAEEKEDAGSNQGERYTTPSGIALVHHVRAVFSAKSKAGHRSSW